MTLVDAESLPTGTEIAGDVCIIGAGPAGLTLARHLRGRGRKIVVLERGGLPGRPLGVGPSDTVVDATSHFEAPPSIPPRIGGAANEWIVRLAWHARGVRMVPLQPIDLERRSWVPHSGWPISWDHLEPFLQRAHDDLGLGEWGYGVDQWEEATAPRLGVEPSGFTTAMERFPRASVITNDHWNELLEAPDVEVVINAPAGSVEGSVDRVERVEIDAGSPGRLCATATTFVIAAGGVVNPRLLLAARNGDGIGANSAAVGRYYTDHLRLMSGTLTPADPQLFSNAGLYSLRQTARGVVMGKLVPTEALQREYEMLNSAAMLLPRPATDVQESVDVVRAALDDIRSRRRPARWPGPKDVMGLAGYVGRLVPGMTVRQRRFPPKTDAGWAAMSGNPVRYSSFAVEHQIEQVPNPSNGLSLSGRRDMDGRLTTEMAWRWDDAELSSIRSTQRAFADAMEAAGIGRFETTEWEAAPTLTTPGGAFHPTGSTRMSATSKSGVVDSDARVHGVSNLFVAGSSIFPTGGSANPTLTLMALSIRLADHLNNRLNNRLDNRLGARPGID